MIYKPINVQYARYGLPTVRLRQGICEPLSHRHSRLPKSFQRHGQRKQYHSSWKTSYASFSPTRQIIRKRGFPISSRRICEGNLHRSPWFHRLQLRNTYFTRMTFHSTAGLYLDHVPNAAGTEIDYMNIDPSVISGNSMREKLSLWQEKYESGKESAAAATSPEDTRSATDDCFYFSDEGELKGKSNEEDELEEDEQTSTSHSDPLEGLAYDIDTLFYHPGDMLEISKLGQEPELAMYITQYEDQVQLYTMNGRWVHQLKNDSSYTISKFFSQEDIEALKPYLPDGPIDPTLLDQAHMVDLSVPRAVGGPIVMKMQAFSREAENVYRKYASTLDNIYETISHPTDLRFATMNSIASNVLNKNSSCISETERYAVRKALLHAGIGVQPDVRNYKQTSMYNILPSDDVKSYGEVLRWIRAYQDHVARNRNDDLTKEDSRSGIFKVKNFIVKAKKLIAESRSLRDKTSYGSVSPVRKRQKLGKEPGALKLVHSTTFNDSDKDIISLFQGWVVTKKLLIQQEFAAAASVIIRAVDEYPDLDTSITTGQLFLQEIGALLPYENRNIYDHCLVLPTSGISRPLKSLNHKLQNLDREESFHLRDRMKELRKDWGQLPVYCIDGEGTHEVDDGISVERVPNSETEYWVHIHVAHPSAFFGTRHPLALMAEHMTANSYFPEVAFSMLPQNLVNSQFSLQADRPTLTFSGKVNSEGEILEYKIQPGIIRNVIKMTPRDTGGYCREDRSARGWREYVVGDASPQKRKEPIKVDDNQAEDLRIMRLIAAARTHRRIRNGGRPWFTSDFYIRVSGAHDKVLPRISMNRNAALFVASDPVIRLRADGYTSPFAGFAQANVDTVGEHMMLAGEIAGRWCIDREIPAIYRGTLANPQKLDEETYQKEIIQSLDNLNRPPKVKEVLKYLKYACFSVNSTRPLPHMHTGIDIMARATSPIRRYTDLLLHWQINEALLHEAGSDKKIGQKRLPFSEEHLKAAITRITPRERLINSLHSSGNAHWVAQFFMRAFHFNQCQLPETFRFLVLHVKRLMPYCQGKVLDFGFQASMAQPSQFDMSTEASIGDIWEVRIEKVDCYRRQVQFLPLHLVQRDGEV